MARRRPTFQRENPAPMQLTEDDISVIRYVAQHRFRRTSDILKLLPHRSPKHLRGRLRKLYDHQYLDRPKAQRDDHLSNGKPHLIHALGNRGAQLISEHDGLTPSKSNWTDKNRDVKRPYIQHTLRTADITDAVQCVPKFMPVVRVLSAADIQSASPPLTQRNPKPWRWQTRVSNADGSIRAISAEPDDVFGLDFTDQRKRYYFFAEADRGTEPIIRSDQKQTSIARKFEAYLAGYHASLHRTLYGIGNLRFLIITTSQQRVHNMLRALAEIAQDRDRSMFLFADFDQLTAAPHALAVPWTTGLGKPSNLLGEAKLQEDYSHASSIHQQQANTNSTHQSPPG